MNYKPQKNIIVIEDIQYINWDIDFKNKLKVPMNKKTRSLNVAMTVAIVTSEALKQLNFFNK